MKKQKFMETFTQLYKDQRGQLDLFGNFIEFVKTVPGFLTLLFLAILVSTTLSITLFGVELSLATPLNIIVKYIAGSFGIFADWRTFVILAFLSVVAVVALKYGKK